MFTWQGYIVPVSTRSAPKWTRVCLPKCQVECGWKYSCHVLRPQCATVIFPTPHTQGFRAVRQGSVSSGAHFPGRVPLQAPQDHIQNENLPPQRRREGPGLPANHQCRKLEASHKSWPRWGGAGWGRGSRLCFDMGQKFQVPFMLHVICSIGTTSELQAQGQCNIVMMLWGLSSVLFSVSDNPFIISETAFLYL